MCIIQGSVTMALYRLPFWYFSELPSCVKGPSTPQNIAQCCFNHKQMCFLPACDEASEPAALGPPWGGLLQGAHVEPEQLGQVLSPDTDVQLYPGPTDQQHHL